MKRLFYYILLAAAMIGATVVVLWIKGFLPSNVNSTGQDLLVNFIKSIENGTFQFGFSAGDIFVYAIVLFSLINAAILITMILIFLFSGFNLNRIAKLYRICVWFIVSAVLLTGAYGYYIIAGMDGFDFAKIFAEIPLLAYVPIGASLLIMIIAIIFRATERKKS